jgi:hypothetical protein
MDEYQLKLVGKVSIPKPLEIGHNYHVAIQGSITKEEKSDNNDGNFTIAYKFEPILVEVLNPKGQTIKAKDKRRVSQKIRGALYYCWKESGSDLSEEQFYEKYGMKIVRYLPEVLELLKRYE